MESNIFTEHLFKLSIFEMLVKILWVLHYELFLCIVLYCIVLKVQHLIKIDNENYNNWKKAGGPKQQFLLI